MKNLYLLGQTVMVDGKSGEIVGFRLEDKVPKYQVYFITTEKTISVTLNEISSSSYREKDCESNNKYWIGEMVCVTRVFQEHLEEYVGKVGKVSNIYMNPEDWIVNYDLIDADGKTIAIEIWEEELAQFTGIFPQSSSLKKRQSSSSSSKKRRRITKKDDDSDSE
ncbi:MAG: hypothetical protein WD512_12455 [Candidatus Paceibacterota bacterium]